MKIAAAVLSLVVAPVVAANEPIFGTDIVHHTVELFKDASNHAYEQAQVDKIVASLPVDSVKKFCMDQYKTVEHHVPPEVWKASDEARLMAMQVTATARAQAAAVMSEVDTRAKAVVHWIESKVPSRKGMINASLGGLVMFTLWMCLVIYIQYRILRFGCGMIYNITWFFWCGICCCRLCRAKKEAAKAPKGKAESKAKAKASNDKSNDKPSNAAKAAPKQKK